MIRRPPRSTQSRSSAASDVYKRQAFDHPASRDRVRGYGIDRMHLESLENVERAAATGLFHVIGHLDQAKKFGHRPDDAEAVTAAASRALRAVRQAGAALELNTAGLPY